MIPTWAPGSTSTTDARSQVTSLAYDKLGRLVQRTEPGLASTWVWDTSPTAGKGRLHTAATGGGYLRTHLYDQKGRPFTTVVAVDGIEMGQMTEYDAAGRIQAQYFTTGQGTRHAYTATGYAHELRDTATNALYWQALDVDAEGHVTREAYGNGVTTTRAYLPQNGRLVTQDARNALNQPVQYNFYGYDLAGNVTLRWDEGGGSGSGDVLAYDALHRLTRVENDTNGVQTLTEVAYDVLGNIAAKDGVGAYLYGGNPGCAPGSGAGPHAVCRAGSEAYAYDANGNLTSGGGRTIGWTAWNMPASITQAGQATTWSYDPEHRRVKMTAPDRTTWYFNPGIHQGGHYQRTRYAGGAVEHRHTLYGGGHPIGEVITFDSAAPPSVRYFHGDRQGSVMAVTTGSASLLSKYRYDPWGRRSIVTGAASGLLATRQGHTGHEMLEIGLTHMNARLYDPVLARFISADPLVQAPHDLQSLNRYGYVFNNPLAYTDPSGYQSNLNEIKITESRWINPLVTVNPLLGDTLAGGLSGGMGGPAFSFQAFAQRMDNVSPAVQSADAASEEPVVLPTINVVETPEFDAGKAADLLGAFTLLGYPLEVYGALYGETFFGREQLTPWERLLGIIPFAGSIRKVGGAAVGAVKAGATVFKSGHYADRLGAKGVDVARAEKAIAERIDTIHSNVAVEAPFRGRFMMDDVMLEYRAFKLPNGSIEVGTIVKVTP